MTIDLVASFYTLTGAGFGQPSRYDFAERCEAASAAGFAGIGMHVDDVDRARAAGLSVGDLRAILADTGLRVVEIEFLSGWAVHRDAAALAAVEQRIYRLADTFGGRHVSAGEFAADDGSFDVEQAANRLAQVAGRAADHGLLVAVEAFPWSPIRDIRIAGQILDLADTPNAGLLIDVWHFFNCGAAVRDIDVMPPGRVTAVQLNDGPRVHDDFLLNARATRWLPGDGELDVTGLIRAVERRGFTGPYCVEVNYPGFRELAALQAGRQAFDKAHAVVTAARTSGARAARSPRAR